MSDNCWETGDGKTFGTKAEVSIYTGSSDPRLMEAVGKPAWQLVWTDNGVRYGSAEGLMPPKAFPREDIRIHPIDLPGVVTTPKSWVSVTGTAYFKTKAEADLYVKYRDRTRESKATLVEPKYQLYWGSKVQGYGSELGLLPTDADNWNGSIAPLGFSGLKVVRVNPAPRSFEAAYNATVGGIQFQTEAEALLWSTHKGAEGWVKPSDRDPQYQLTWIDGEGIRWGSKDGLLPPEGTKLSWATNLNYSGYPLRTTLPVESAPKAETVVRSWGHYNFRFRTEKEARDCFSNYSREYQNRTTVKEHSVPPKHMWVDGTIEEIGDLDLGKSQLGWEAAYKDMVHPCIFRTWQEAKAWSQIDSGGWVEPSYAAPSHQVLTRFGGVTYGSKEGFIAPSFLLKTPDTWASDLSDFAYETSEDSASDCQLVYPKSWKVGDTWFKDLSDALATGASPSEVKGFAEVPKPSQAKDSDDGRVVTSWGVATNRFKTKAEAECYYTTSPKWFRDLYPVKPTTDEPSAQLVWVVNGVSYGSKNGLMPPKEKQKEGGVSSTGLDAPLMDKNVQPTSSTKSWTWDHSTHHFETKEEARWASYGNPVLVPSDKEPTHKVAHSEWVLADTLSPKGTGDNYVLFDDPLFGGYGTYYTGGDDLWVSEFHKAKFMSAETLLKALEECDGSGVYRARFTAQTLRVKRLDENPPLTVLSADTLPTKPLGFKVYEKISTARSSVEWDKGAIDAGPPSSSQAVEDKSLLTYLLIGVLGTSILAFKTKQHQMSMNESMKRGIERMRANGAFDEDSIDPIAGGPKGRAVAEARNRARLNIEEEVGNVRTLEKSNG